MVNTLHELLQRRKAQKETFRDNPLPLEEIERLHREINGPAIYAKIGKLGSQNQPDLMDARV